MNNPHFIVTTLDSLSKSPLIIIEPEELVEPENETPCDVPSSRVQRLRERLSHYGNRVIQSAKNFIITIGETVSNVFNAIAGSLILLPMLILLRGIKVILVNFFTIFKPLTLSFFRVVFDGLRALIWPLHEAFTGYNKRVLNPLIKQVKEDDTSAVIAFFVLVVVTVGVIIALSWIL